MLVIIAFTPAACLPQPIVLTHQFSKTTCLSLSDCVPTNSKSTVITTFTVAICMRVTDKCIFGTSLLLKCAFCFFCQCAYPLIDMEKKLNMNILT